MTGASAEQALTQARAIETLREHSRVYLSVLVDQDDEITALRATVRALAEALTAILDDAEHSWLTYEGRLEQVKETARAALSRTGVVGGREEGEEG